MREKKDYELTSLIIGILKAFVNSFLKDYEERS